ASVLGIVDRQRLARSSPELNVIAGDSFAIDDAGARASQCLDNQREAGGGGGGGANVSTISGKRRVRSLPGRQVRCNIMPIAKGYSPVSQPLFYLLFICTSLPLG